MINKFFRLLDWFVPDLARYDQSELGVARMFVFTHLAGPALAQSMVIFLYRTDPEPGFACWVIIACIYSFWLLPFVLKFTKSLQFSALVSVELLAFASLFGSYYYGGVSSPFLPWLIVSLFLGFFYLSHHPLLLTGVFTVNLMGFIGAYLLYGFPVRVPLDALSTLGWVSIGSATVYMSWMAIYYNIMITMRSELEREIERHQETGLLLTQAKEHAEKANRVKSIFLAKMSHGLRTPLNAMIGYSDILLEDEIARGHNARVLDLQRINDASKHLLSLVTDVLDLSKIETNMTDLVVQSFDIKEFAEAVIPTVQPLAAANRNTLVLQCADNLGIAQTDVTKLRQSVLNLLSNAAKFTTNGTITMTVLRQLNEAADWIEIRVQDTGIGISAEDMPRLFRDFQQATVSTSLKYGGTGLGLALSQKLCGLMGGGITCRSEVARGSCFVIRVPTTLNQVPSYAEAESDPEMRSPARSAAAAA